MFLLSVPTDEPKTCFVRGLCTGRAWSVLEWSHNGVRPIGHIHLQKSLKKTQMNDYSQHIFYECSSEVGTIFFGYSNLTLFRQPPSNSLDFQKRKEASLCVQSSKRSHICSSRALVSMRGNTRECFSDVTMHWFFESHKQCVYMCISDFHVFRRMEHILHTLSTITVISVSACQSMLESPNCVCLCFVLILKRRRRGRKNRNVFICFAVSVK